MHDRRVVSRRRRRLHRIHQSPDVRQAADPFERVAIAQLFADGDLVDRFVVLEQVHEHRENRFVNVRVEIVGPQHLADLSHHRLVDENRAEHRHLRLEIVGRYAVDRRGKRLSAHGRRAPLRRGACERLVERLCICNSRRTCSTPETATTSMPVERRVDLARVFFRHDHPAHPSLPRCVEFLDHPADRAHFALNRKLARNRDVLRHRRLGDRRVEGEEDRESGGRSVDVSAADDVDVQVEIGRLDARGGARITLVALKTESLAIEPAASLKRIVPLPGCEAGNATASISMMLPR